MIIINNELCIGCGRCEEVCTTGAITINKTTQKAVFNKYRCAECGVCIDECKKGAISFDKSQQEEHNIPGKEGRSLGKSAETGRKNMKVRGRGQGAGRGGMGRGKGASGDCVCPNCGNAMPHSAGVPCSQVKCPNCGSFMRRR